MNSMTRRFSHACILTLSILLLSILAASPAFAGYPKKSKEKTTPIPVDTNDKITALHLTSIMITVAATHQGKEYKVNSATKITINGQPGALNGLAVGMDVSVTPTPNDPTTAAAIDAKTHR
jgi:hypothetical protein